MRTATVIAGQEKQEILHLARVCERLFSKYADQQLPFSETRARAELQQQRFYVWASYLGVFAHPSASLDKRLEYSDEIRSLVIQLLSLMRRNLEFITFSDLEESSQESLTLSIEAPKRKSTLKLKGTPSEALDAVEATINRLNKLGATVRKYSTSNLDNRVRAFTEKHGDENYTQLAKQIVHFKYRTASPSLKDQLAVSMSARRQRLRYIRRHQEKLASQLRADSQPRASNQPEELIKGKRSFLLALQGVGNGVPEGEVTSGPSRKRMALRQSHGSPFLKMFAPSETNASFFEPTQSVVARLQRGDGASVVSSSRDSTTFMAEDLEDYPEPPKKELEKPDPLCLFCCRPLQDSELKQGKWQRHVNQDLQPFVCISEKCGQPPLEDFEIWAKHMRDLHSMKWTQLVHKPIIWQCNVDHQEEEFQEEEAFEEHLDSQHRDCSAAERKAISISSMIPRRRAINICPLCNYDISASHIGVSGSQGQNEAAPIPTKADEFEQLNKLAKHIAGHLRRLAFDSSNNLDSESDDASRASAKTSNGKNRNGSKTRPPSGLKDLSNISLTFDDDLATGLGRLGNQNGDFDPEWTAADLEFLNSSPNELPSTEVFHWHDVKVILKERMDLKIIAELEHEEDTTAPDPILQHIFQRLPIAIAGTCGLALIISREIREQTSHQLLILSRSPQPRLTSQGYQCLTVDYNDPASIRHSLIGVDTVISTVTGTPQLRLIEAAVAQRVRRFAPAEFEGSPSLRTVSDPLDRGKADALRALQHYHSYIQSTVFACGILYERFAPNGLAAYQIGVNSGFANEGDYILNARNMTAQAPVYNSANNLSSLCMTSVYDVGRFIVRALDMAQWPSELTMCGERTSVSMLVETVKQCRERQFAHVQWHNPDTLRYELTLARVSGDIAKQIRLFPLIATAEGHYDFTWPAYLNSQFPDIHPERFRDWFVRNWAGVPVDSSWI